MLYEGSNLTKWWTQLKGGFLYNRPLKIHFLSKLLMAENFDFHGRCRYNVESLKKGCHIQIRFMPHINSTERITACTNLNDRKPLDQYTAIYVTNAIFKSCIDYCYSVRYGGHKTNVKNLKRVQNVHARIVTQSSRSISITEIFCDLY